ncbi:translation termination factor GTPase eRF3 [Rhodotorula kratochvilovae]
MFARTFSLTALLAFAVALLAVDHANAVMSQGNINLVRDHVLQYSTSKFATTEAFCKKFRSACVSYVGPIGTYGSHHQLDCVFQNPDGSAVQPGPRIHAFCGGLAKNPDGTWTNGGTVTDYTKQLVKKSFASTVTVKGGPISVKECKAPRASTVLAC